MKVFLRQRQQTKKGKVSLYLELYKGTKINESGKIVPDRDYEYLDLYLVSKAKKPIDRKHNNESLELANGIRAKRELEIKNGMHGFVPKFKGNANFIDYFQHQSNQKQTQATKDTWNSVLKLMKEFAGESVNFNSVNKQFIEGFKNFLDTAKKRDETPFSINTKCIYFHKIRAVLNQAVRDEIINKNPAHLVDNWKLQETNRAYLTVEEIQKLFDTDCKNDVLKRAFLFSCLSGLRLSDVEKLKWKDIECLNGQWRINFRQTKTHGLEYQDIALQAWELMGEAKDGNRKIFDFKMNAYGYKQLTSWCEAAGIKKKITFHSGRHTQAVMQLTLGTDLYTVSKLLGHRDIKTTQIYARIIDSKKAEAVNKIPTFNSTK